MVITKNKIILNRDEQSAICPPPSGDTHMQGRGEDTGSNAIFYQFPHLRFTGLHNSHYQ